MKKKLLISVINNLLAAIESSSEIGGYSCSLLDETRKLPPSIINNGYIEEELTGWHTVNLKIKWKSK